MMDILIAYDINVDRHDELKSELIESGGFLDYWYDKNRRINDLPDTTLIVSAMNPTHARSIFDEVTDKLNKDKSPEEHIKATKFVAVQATLFLGIPRD